MAKNGAENGAAPKAKIAKKVGRRTKCTEDYVSRFLERIEAGQSVPAAAAVAGLHISTVMEWLAREWVNPGGQFAEFAAAYARAKSVGENRLVSQIVVHGAKDWRATAWLFGASASRSVELQLLNRRQLGAIIV